ncbi:MAG: hypothetical protein JSR42_17460 [Proteobacteria bacterium]|nr:hypothetical protein [Pseudomonadota bacterium]
MSYPFNKLEGFPRTPAGEERRVLRLLPRILIVGSLLLGLPSMVARLFDAVGGAASATLVTTVDIYSISLVVLHWTVVLTVAIAAFIVMVMKGPAYVADAYPLDDADAPQDPGPGAQR